MQIFSFLWIVLCLIAVTSSRTARSTYNETGEHGSPLKSLQKDEVCDCGENSSSCKYENGKKVCRCLKDYAQKDGKCEICDCGENSFPYYCKYENGEKVCDCTTGYAQKDGQCEICDCGKNSYTRSCIYNVSGEKVCRCHPSYAQKDGKCESCDCGKNSFRDHCKFENGEIVCRCYPGYAQLDVECEICNCGKNMQPCKYENGKKVCDCRLGYVEIDGKCEKISISSTVTEAVTTPVFSTLTPTIPPPCRGVDIYAITLVAVSVFSSIVLLIVACVMCQRYRVTRTS